MSSSNTKKKKSWKKSLFSISASSTRSASSGLTGSPSNNSYLDNSGADLSVDSVSSGRRSTSQSGNYTTAPAPSPASGSADSSAAGDGSRKPSASRVPTRKSSRNLLTPEDMAMITPRNTTRRSYNANPTKRKSLFGLSSMFDPFSSSSATATASPQASSIPNPVSYRRSTDAAPFINATTRLNTQKAASEPKAENQKKKLTLNLDSPTSQRSNSVKLKKTSSTPNSNSPVSEKSSTAKFRNTRSKSNLSSPISPRFKSFLQSGNDKSDDLNSSASDHPILESHQRLLQNFLNDCPVVLDNDIDNNSQILTPQKSNNGEHEDEEDDEFHDLEDYNYSSLIDTDAQTENDTTTMETSNVEATVSNGNTKSSQEANKQKIANTKNSNLIIDHFKNSNRKDEPSSRRSKGKSKAKSVPILDTSADNVSDRTSSAVPLSAASLKSPSYRDRHREIFNKNFDQQSSQDPIASHPTISSPVNSTVTSSSTEYFTSRMRSPVSPTNFPSSLNNSRNNTRIDCISHNNIPRSSSTKNINSSLDFSDDDDDVPVVTNQEEYEGKKFQNNQYSRTNSNTTDTADAAESDVDLIGATSSLLDDMTRNAISSPSNADTSNVSNTNGNDLLGSVVSASSINNHNSAVTSSRTASSGSHHSHNVNLQQNYSSVPSSNSSREQNNSHHPIIEDHHSRINLLNPFRRHRFNIRSTRSAQNHQQFQYHLDNLDYENENNHHANLQGLSNNNSITVPTVLQYQSEMLSRLLITASQSTLRNLIGTSYRPAEGVRIDNRNRNRDLNTLFSNNGSFEDGSDSTFAEFCHALRHGNLIANELSNSARNESLAHSNNESNSMSFFRAFRFPPRIMNEDADGNPIPVRSNSNSNSQNSNGDGTNANGDDNDDQEEMVPVLILGVRSVMPGEVSHTRHTTANSAASATNNSTASASHAGNSVGSSGNTTSVSGNNSASSRNQNESSDTDENQGRFGRSFFRNRTHRSRFRLENSRNNNRLEEIAQQYSRSRNLQSTFGGTLDGNIFTTSEPSNHRSSSLPSVASLSSNHTDHSTHTNGSSSNASTTRNERSWVIFMMGHNFPLDHPVLTAPTLLSENPSYEDLLALQAMLGEVKAPVATTEELEAGGGLVHFIVAGETFPIDEEDQIYPDVENVDATDRCLVCLTEFETGEVGRKLKACGHVYHKECIDQWLTTGRNSCPLCRKKGVPTIKKKSSSPTTNDPTNTLPSGENISSGTANLPASTINERHGSIGTIDIIGNGNTPLDFSHDIQNHFNM